MNNLGFTRMRVVGGLAALLLAGSLAMAQDDSSSGSSGAVPAATAPAEQNNVENPPLSGLDQPTAEPAFGGRSYLMPGFQASESVDSNASGSSANSHTSEITRALGSMDLQKIWKTYQLGLDYIAAGDFYTGPIYAKSQNQNRATQAHTFAAVQRILWRTGQLAIRDSFDYLPEGSFGFSSYGGAASFGSSLGGGLSGSGAGTGMGGGLGGGTGSVSYGSFGYQPRIDNSAIVDIVQGLSPRSTVTLSGGYSLSHFLDVSNPLFPVINSQQTSAQAGYNHLLNRKDQIGFDYAFQELHFPHAGSGSVTAHVWNVLYGHRITGKLNLSLGGGPQLVIVHHPPALLVPPVVPVPVLVAVPETRSLSAGGSVAFTYTVSTRTNVQVAYRRYVTPGSGFYAGANTDSVRVSLGRRFGRRWTTTTDAGYSHNSNLQTANTSTGVPSRSYEFWYAGSSLQRQLGPHFTAFASYQFNDLGFASCITGLSTTCGTKSTRHTGMIGFNWHPKPIRLD